MAWPLGVMTATDTSRPSVAVTLTTESRATLVDPSAGSTTSDTPFTVVVTPPPVAAALALGLVDELVTT